MTSRRRLLSSALFLLVPACATTDSDPFTEEAECLDGIDQCDGVSIVGNEEDEPADDDASSSPASNASFDSTDGPLAGGAFRDVWFPDGNIPFIMDSSFSSGEQTAIRDAMDFLEEHSPLDTTLFTSLGGRGLRFKDVSTTFFCGKTEGYWNHNKSNPIIALDDGCATEGTVHHEMFHALGFPHEFQRADRDDHANICFNLDPFNYGKTGSAFWPDDHAVLSPFDFESVTNLGYTGSSGCVSGIDGTFARPMWNGAQQPLSRHDINSIYRVYGEALGAGNDDQSFSNTLVAGDFDDDQIEDLVVISREAAGAWGLIWLNFYRGVDLDDSEGGAGRKFVPWFRHLLDLTTDSSVQLSSAAGDFDGDGILDLAVGDPSRNSDEGRVYVVTVNVSGGNTAPWGLSGIESVDRIDADEVGLQSGRPHRFGASLATGLLTDLGHDDLVIGAPNAEKVVNAGPAVLIQRAGGAVVHLPAADPDDAEITWNPEFFPPFNGASNEFGAAVTTMPYYCDFDPNAGNDQFATFAVGAPGYDVDSGAIYVYGCARTEAGAVIEPDQLRRVTHSQEGARYGEAIAGFRAAAIASDMRNFLVVGTPRYVGGGVRTGKIYLDEFDALGNKTFIGSYRPSNTVGNDRFGASLAVFQGGDIGIVDRRFVHIAIGMPNTERNGVRSGKVYMWRPFNTTSINSTAAVWSPSSPTSGMKFGEHVIAVHSDSPNGGFAIAAPNGMVGSDVAGRVRVRLDSNGSSTSWSSSSQEISIETGPDKPPFNL